MAGCLFSGRQGEVRSVYYEPAVCLEYFIQHSPACVQEPFSPLHSCRFTQQEPLHPERLGSSSPSPSPAPLPWGGGGGGGGGFSSWGGQRRAPFFRLAARSMETVFIASAFRWEEQLDPSPRPCLSFSRIQELEAICPPACVCATSAVLPTYRSRLGQACAVLKVIWWQVQFKCSNTAINQATIFISI